ncbi:MAG: hypothetical protein IM669_05230 [Phenylobacterium sp.]|uniref:hypothetical protein n=1 Tax=Phenylobacterium sp. TaxID=1871053 RepID=UPI0025E650FB|nr:hypothetical protein [Phenylobacterium sp.]MCA3756911.1 hypothetical protein [Phenylobacterium sp.]
MTGIVIAQQFCGPPTSGNGGYCAGLLARNLAGPVIAVLKARIPLDVTLDLSSDSAGSILTGPEGEVIGEGRPGVPEDLPQPPTPPAWEAALAAEARHIGIGQRFHPICFSCGPERAEGVGLRVFAGQIEGAPEGHLACTWIPHANFADTEGLTPVEVIWAALDCPGFFAWVVREGRHGALLGTMTGEVLRRPRAGEPCIVTAWPLERSGRKETAGVALFSVEGELLARAHQVWIVMSAPPRPAAA